MTSAWTVAWEAVLAWRLVGICESSFGWDCTYGIEHDIDHEAHVSVTAYVSPPSDSPTETKHSWSARSLHSSIFRLPGWLSRSGITAYFPHSIFYLTDYGASLRPGIK